jgi:hypothetical protein
MCSRGAPATLVGCSVGVEGSCAARTAGAVAYVRCAVDEEIAVLLAKARANEQLGQAIVICVGYMRPCKRLLSIRVGVQ